MPRKFSDITKSSSTIENRSSKEIKTTDVNILLNRVRSDKKKTFKKNILVSLFLVSLVGLITIFFTI